MFFSTKEKSCENRWFNNCLCRSVFSLQLDERNDSVRSVRALNVTTDTNTSAMESRG